MREEVLLLLLSHILLLVVVDAAGGASRALAFAPGLAATRTPKVTARLAPQDGPRALIKKAGHGCVIGGGGGCLSSGGLHLRSHDGFLGGLSMMGYRHENPDLGPAIPTTLSSWAKENGMSWGGWKVGQAPSGIRGAIAIRDIEKGEVIVAAPMEATLFTHVGQKIPFPTSFLTEEAWEDLDERFWNTKMALRLVYEKRLGASSKFADYISVLPDAFTTLLSFSESEIPELQWKPLIQTAEDDKLFYGYIRDKLVASMQVPITEEEFTWGLSCAGSRTFTANFGTGEDGEIMCPVADMVNHNPLSAPSMRFMADTKLFELFSPLATARGDEICISYGNVSNHHLLHYYGFVPDDNVYDYIPITEYELITARDAIRGDYEVSSLKGTHSRVLKNLIDSCAQGLSLPLRHLKDSSRITQVEGDAEMKLRGCMSELDAILLYCRVLCLDDEEIGAGPMDLARRLQNLRELNDRNEMEANKLISSVLANHLASMATSLEHDEAIEASGYAGLSDNAIQAVRFRIRRKRMLREAMGAISSKFSGPAQSQ